MVKEESEKMLTVRESEILWESHRREHQAHDHAHQVEHELTSDALIKADTALERRLEGMNEFRAQLDKQTATFLTREVFENFVKEQTTKTELALATTSDKYDTIIKAIVNRHESDSDNLHAEIQTAKEALRVEIQGEREYRKTFEGSINTWKWLVGFLGVSGVAGVIYMFATQQHP